MPFRSTTRFGFGDHLSTEAVAGANRPSLGTSPMTVSDPDRTPNPLPWPPIIVTGAPAALFVMTWLLPVDPLCRDHWHRAWSALCFWCVGRVWISPPL
jgi:hypothetical protein